MGFQGPKNSGGHQKWAKSSHICYSDHFCKNLSKNLSFWQSCYFTMQIQQSKKDNFKITNFLTKKMLLAQGENFKLRKVFKVKMLSVFGFDTFLTMVSALWWIYKKLHRWILIFFHLVSSILVRDSKN